MAIQITQAMVNAGLFELNSALGSTDLKVEEILEHSLNGNISRSSATANLNRSLRLFHSAHHYTTTYSNNITIKIHLFEPWESTDSTMQYSSGYTVQNAVYQRRHLDFLFLSLATEKRIDVHIEPLNTNARTNDPRALETSAAAFFIEISYFGLF